MACDVALVGVGRWGKLILRDLCALGCRVHVASKSSTTAAQALHWGAKTATTQIDEIPAVEGAVVATPTTTHYAVIQSLLERRVPLFVEKPLCASLDHAHKLLAVAEDRIFVMDKWRYHRGVLALAAIAKSEELGSVQSLHLTRVGWKSKARSTDVLFYLAPHDLSIAREILGRIPSPRCARASFIGGRATAVHALLGASPWVSLEVSESSPIRRREVRLVCDGGVARLADSYSSSLEIQRFQRPLEDAKTDAELRSFKEEMPLLEELRAFVHYLQGGPPPKSPCAEAVRTVEILHHLSRLCERTDVAMA